MQRQRRHRPRPVPEPGYPAGDQELQLHRLLAPAAAPHRLLGVLADVRRSDARPRARGVRSRPGQPRLRSHILDGRVGLAAFLTRRLLGSVAVLLAALVGPARRARSGDAALGRRGDGESPLWSDPGVRDDSVGESRSHGADGPRAHTRLRLELVSGFLSQLASPVDTSCAAQVLPLDFKGIPTWNRLLWGTDDPGRGPSDLGASQYPAAPATQDLAAFEPVPPDGQAQPFAFLVRPARESTTRQTQPLGRRSHHRSSTRRSSLSKGRLVLHPSRIHRIPKCPTIKTYPRPFLQQGPCACASCRMPRKPPALPVVSSAAFDASKRSHPIPRDRRSALPRPSSHRTARLCPPSRRKPSRVAISPMEPRQWGS